MTIFEFVSTWLLGFLSNSLGNDSVAIAQCREDLIALEKGLEDLKSYVNYPIRVTAEKIKAIEVALKKLNAHHAGLFIKNSELQELIEKSLARIKGWQLDPSKDGCNITSFVGVDLRIFWSSSIQVLDLARIEEFQDQFFHQGLMIRSLYFFKKNPMNASCVISLVVIVWFIAIQWFGF